MLIENEPNINRLFDLVINIDYEMLIENEPNINRLFDSFFWWLVELPEDWFTGRFIFIRKLFPNGKWPEEKVSSSLTVHKLLIPFLYFC